MSEPHPRELLRRFDEVVRLVERVAAQLLADAVRHRPSTTHPPEGDRMMLDPTATPVRADRRLCPSCGATPGGCRACLELGGRPCCTACRGDHDSEENR